MAILLNNASFVLSLLLISCLMQRQKLRLVLFEHNMSLTQFESKSASCGKRKSIAFTMVLTQVLSNSFRQLDSTSLYPIAQSSTGLVKWGRSVKVLTCILGVLRIHEGVCSWTPPPVVTNFFGSLGPEKPACQKDPACFLRCSTFWGGRHFWSHPGSHVKLQCGLALFLGAILTLS